MTGSRGCRLVALRPLLLKALSKSSVVGGIFDSRKSGPHGPRSIPPLYNLKNTKKKGVILHGPCGPCSVTESCHTPLFFIPTDVVLYLYFSRDPQLRLKADSEMWVSPDESETTKSVTSSGFAPQGSSHVPLLASNGKGVRVVR